MTVTGGLYVCTGVIGFTGETCDAKVTSATWEGDVECNPGDDSVTVTVDLSRSDYDDSCILSGTATGTIGGDDISITMTESAVVDCKSLGGSWTQRIGDNDYTVSVRCLP